MSSPIDRKHGSRQSRAKSRGLSFRLKSVWWLAVAMGLMGASILSYLCFVPIDIPGEARTFTIRQGSSLHEVARQLSARGIIHDPWSFLILARIRTDAGNIKAGAYSVESRSTSAAILTKITRGDFSRTEIRVTEGWTFRQMRHELDQNPSLRHDTLGISDRELMAQIDPAVTHPEGMFFPATYFFAAGTSDLTILRQAYQAMQSRLNTLWRKRRPGLPLASPYEALILASIVEKETGRESDRAMIASVLVNRLKRGMRLQSDPTVIYGMGLAFDGNLRKQDLLADQKYNSYTRAGLPPTPIALPGEAALAAAMNPELSKALYFVARGDGSSVFSQTLDEHNHAVNKYQK